MECLKVIFTQNSYISTHVNHFIVYGLTVSITVFRFHKDFTHGKLSLQGGAMPKGQSVRRSAESYCSRSFPIGVIGYAADIYVNPFPGRKTRCFTNTCRTLQGGVNPPFRGKSAFRAHTKTQDGLPFLSERTLRAR